MEISKEPFNVMSETVSKTMEQAQGAMEKYFNFIQKNMPASLWAETDFSKKMRSYAEQNFAAASEFAKKLTQAKDLPDFIRIQTEFLQTQCSALSEQARDLGEAATKVATDAFKAPFNLSS